MATKLESRAFQVEDSFDEVFDYYYKQGWTDGLPVVPPTRERVERMLTGTDLAPDTVLCEVPPRRAHITVEKIAVNAVMAGCLPPYLPVIIAAIEAVCDPAFNLFGVNTTTSPVCVCTVVNGPIRNELNINGGYSFLGPGNRANATMGRAIRLVQLNVGGSIPGQVTKSTAGQPGRYTMLFGEWEERLPAGWNPLHVDRGFKKEDSTVSVYSCTGTTSICDTNSKTALATATSMSSCMKWIGSNNHCVAPGAGESLLVLCPDHAMVIARDGWTKADLQKFLLENTRSPLSDWPQEKWEMVKQRASYRDGYTYTHLRPEQYEVCVAGGPGGFHSVWIPTWGDSFTVTKPVRTKK